MASIISSFHLGDVLGYALVIFYDVIVIHEMEQTACVSSWNCIYF